MMKIIDETKAIELIKATKGQIFTAEFIKRKDQTFRRMTCRTEVKKGTKHKGFKFDPFEKGLAGVYEMLHIDHEPEDKHFRFINLDQLLSLVINHKTYSIQ